MASVPAAVSVNESAVRDTAVEDSKAGAVRVLVVDDHAILRAGLREMLNLEEDVRVVAEAASAEEALQHLLAGLNVDLMLLDVSLPGQNGIDFLRQLKVDYPHIAVLMLSMHPEQAFAVRVMRAGASGYVPKMAVPEELLKAIRVAAAGRKYVSALVAELLVADMDSNADGLAHNLLSPRELQIFLRIARGMSPGAMAAELGLSVKTISTYRARILEKMNVASNAEIAGYAVRNKIVE
jgi:two-component system invasion response regulator UvrY